MSESSTTVRDVFELPEPGADGSDNWKTFKTKVTKEVKGIKTAALPDLAKKVAELFEIPIPDIFLNSWKKAGGIQALLEESRTAPETVMSAELGEHTINSQHRPQIEIRIQNKTVKKLEFTLKLAFNLKGFVLKIKNGKIREIQTGSCEVRGKMEYEGLVIADKKLAPITLPGVISLDLGSESAETAVVPGNKPSVLPSTSKDAGLAKPSVSAAVIAESKTVVAPTEEARNSPRDSTGLKEMPPRDVLRELAAPVIVQSSSSKPPVDEAVTPAPERGQTVESKGDLTTSEPEPPIVHPTPEPAEEAEERMTWEVGDDEPAESAPVEAATSAEAAAGEENAEDIISKMSRELAEKRQSTRG